MKKIQRSSVSEVCNLREADLKFSKPERFSSTKGLG
jgi:hypothetical protein